MSTVNKGHESSLHPVPLPEASGEAPPELDDAPEKTPVAVVVDWDGPDDPDNPQNWPLPKRIYNTAVSASLAFVVTFGSSIYTPAIPAVSERFGVSRTAAVLPLSLYTLAIGIGPVLAAPISETKGRRLVYWTSVPLSMLFTLGSGFSQSFAALCVCRFFAGMFGSPVLAVGFGSNADIWPKDVQAIAISGAMIAPFAGPALGPSVGGFAVMGESWRWTMWVLLMFTLAFYIGTAGMSESYKKIILQRRAKKRGISAAPALTAPALSKMAVVKFFLTVTLFRPIHMLLTEPIVAFFSIYVAFSFAVLFAFFPAFPIVFEGVYGFNPGESGLAFLAIGLGVLLASLTGIIIDRTVYIKKHRKAVAQGYKNTVPEHRLYIAMMGSIGLPVGLFWFAWTARSDVHWICCVLAAVPFAWGNLSIFMSAALYLLDVYGPMTGASAMAANGLLRYAFGAAFPLFTVQMYEKLGIAWATSLFGFVSIAMMPIPWVLFKWGPAIRARSRYVRP